MHAIDLLRFLLGDPTTIRNVATSPGGVWVGGALVLSAALARITAHREPRRGLRHLLTPFLASLLSASLLFAWIHLFAHLDGGALPFHWGALHGFIGVFWWTAPLAWLYAAPWERLASSRTRAVQLRLAVLALVATWRVALITQALSVLLQAPAWQLAFPVLLVGDALLMAAVATTTSHDPTAPRPPTAPTILQDMGAMSPNGRDAERLLKDAGCFVLLVGSLLLPITLVGSFLANHTPHWTPLPHVDAQGPQIELDLSTLALLSVLAWATRLPAAQRRFHHAHTLDTLLAARRLPEARLLWNTLRPSDLPPSWDPHPSGTFTPEGTANLLHTVEHLDHDTPPWIRQTFLDALHDLAREPLHYYFDPPLLQRLVALCDTLPEGPSLARHALAAIERLETHRLSADHLPPRFASLEDVPEPMRWPDQTPALQAALTSLRTRAAS